MSILAIPPGYPVPDCFALEFDFTPGVDPYNRTTLRRLSDQERIRCIISECAEPPTLEQINEHFPKKEG